MYIDPVFSVVGIDIMSNALTSSVDDLYMSSPSIKPIEMNNKKVSPSPVSERKREFALQKLVCNYTDYLF